MVGLCGRPVSVQHPSRFQTTGVEVESLAPDGRTPSAVGARKGAWGAGLVAQGTGEVCLRFQV